MTSQSEPLIISSGKRELLVDPPVMNAAGFLAFPDRKPPPEIGHSRFGALISPPTSLKARRPAADAGSRRFPGGFLLHSGHANPGLEQVLRRHARGWTDMETPVLVHLLASRHRDTEHALLLLEQDERIAGVEIGLDDPAPTEVERAASLAAAAELPVILRLPLDAHIDAFQRAQAAGAPALSLGPPRGRLRSDSGYMSGRLYGPALFPLALEKVGALAGSLAVPLIASGGLYTQENLWDFLDAGAAGLQLDGLLWTRPNEPVSAVWDLSANP